MTDDSTGTPDLGGRPTKYDPTFVDQVYKLCLLGAIDKDIADFFEVSEATIYTWKLIHPEFFDAIKRGKKLADMHIASKLYNRAEGAEWIEEAAFKVKTEYFDDTGKKIRTEERIETAPVRKAAPPDTKAIIYWLNNRSEGRWRDKQDHELTGKDGAALTNEITVTVVKPALTET